MSDEQHVHALFSAEKMRKARDSFFWVDADPESGERIFFENSGGSFRLKKAVEAKSRYEELPDCPERTHERALELVGVQKKAEDDILRVVCGSSGAVLDCALTASQLNFKLAEVLAENVPGTNIVTSVLEHPSAFDAAAFVAEKTGKELRVAKADPATGRVDEDGMVRLVDGDTCFLSVMYASNITGSVMDVGSIVRRARERKPGLYCICDAVQHAMHGVMDMDGLGLDALVFAPYKFFSTRGAGYAALSPRMSLLRHHKLAGKPAGVWELGSPTPSNFAAVSAVVDYVCSMGDAPAAQDRRESFVSGMNAIREHETALYGLMLDGTGGQKGLRRIPGVRVFCDDPDLSRKDLIIGFAIDGFDCAELVRRYAAERITVYERVKSSIYSVRMLEALGIDGCIRVSPLHCNTADEVERFLSVTEKLAKSAPGSAGTGRGD